MAVIIGQTNKKPLTWCYPAQGLLVLPVGMTGFEPATP